MSDAREHVRVSILGSVNGTKAFREARKIDAALPKAAASFFTSETSGFQYDTTTVLPVAEILPNLRKTFADSAQYAVFMQQDKTKDCLGREAHHVLLVCNDFGLNS